MTSPACAAEPTVARRVNVALRALEDRPPRTADPGVTSMIMHDGSPRAASYGALSLGLPPSAKPIELWPEMLG